MTTHDLDNDEVVIIEHEEGTSTVLVMTEELSNQFIDYLINNKLNDIQ